MKKIHFYKMEGAGNDFVVIDNRSNHLETSFLISITPTLCDRKFGIGADGLLVLQSPQIENVDYTMLYRNADGSDAGMCGNGSRCLALLATKLGLSTNLAFNVHDKIYHAEVNDDKQSVSVNFPDVVIPNERVIGNHTLSQIYTGTEHIVSSVTKSEINDNSHLIETGRYLRNHSMFNPLGTNVNFAFKTSSNSINIKTYERGVEGLTLACGTGAIAAALVMHYSSNPKLSSERNSVTVNAEGGILEVSFDFISNKKMYTNIFLKGPASIVFEGKINVK